MLQANVRSNGGGAAATAAPGSALLAPPGLTSLAQLELVGRLLQHLGGVLILAAAAKQAEGVEPLVGLGQPLPALGGGVHRAGGPLGRCSAGGQAHDGLGRASAPRAAAAAAAPPGTGRCWRVLPPPLPSSPQPTGAAVGLPALRSGRTNWLGELDRRSRRAQRETGAICAVWRGRSNGRRPAPRVGVVMRPAGGWPPAVMQGLGAGILDRGDRDRRCRPLEKPSCSPPARRPPSPNATRCPLQSLPTSTGAPCALDSPAPRLDQTLLSLEAQPKGLGGQQQL